METKLHAPDIECDGCANSIKRALGRLSGVQRVDVDVERKDVTVIHDTTLNGQEIASALDRAGFPVAS